MANALKEKSNYISILLLTTDIGNDVFREVLKTRCPNGYSYADYFRQYEKILKRLLNASQKEILFPKIGTFSENLEELDLSLLYVLLRSACSIIPPSNGWGQPPDEKDRSMAANIERIHLIRNKYVGHSPCARIEQSEFQSEFQIVVRSIIELGGQQFICKITEMLKENFEIEELSSILKKITILEDAALTELRNQTVIETEEKEKMRESDNLFVNTKVAEDAYNVLNEDQMLIIIGSPGSGKTTTAFHIAFEMEKEGYAIHLAKEPQDIKRYASQEKREIFIFDDVCGKFCLNGSIVNAWEHHESDINTVLNLRTNIKIIIISRSSIPVLDVFKGFDAFKKENVVYTTMSLEERRFLCELCLSKKTAKLLDDETLLKFNFFPLLCKMFYRKENKQKLIEFFTSPIEIIHEELKMIQKKDELAFLSLAVLVVLNNSVEMELFRPDNKRLKSIVKSISGECEISCNSMPHLIRSKFEALTESFVIKNETEIRAVHDKMFDIMVSFFGKHLVTTILSHGESAFISTRLQLVSVDNNKKDFVVMVPNEAEEVYFEAVKRFLQNNKCWEVFGNNQSKSMKYRKRFIEFLKTQRDLSWTIFDTDDASPLFVSAFCGHIDYCKYIIEQDESLIDECDQFGRSPLYAASRNGYVTIVHLLLENGADVNMMSLLNISPLHKAVENKYITYILLLYGADVNQRGWKQRTPLHFACERGNEEVVQCLIDHKAEIDSLDEDKWTPLRISTHLEHKNIVDILLKNEAKLNLCQKDGLSPLTAWWKYYSKLLHVCNDSYIYNDSSDIQGEASFTSISRTSTLYRRLQTRRTRRKNKDKQRNSSIKFHIFIFFSSLCFLVIGIHWLNRELI